jgi:hypothetical protein
VTNDDLPSAQRVYARIQAQHGLPLMTYTDGESSGQLDGTMKELFSRTIRNEEVELLHYESTQAGPSAQQFSISRPLMAADVMGECLALSATQLSIARQSRLRERNREAVKAKSSMAIAVEKGASIELVQWLLDMGHERGDFSRDMRGCTIVSLAAQHNRTDVIEACCIDAVAHAATLHHQRSLIYGIPYGFHHHIAEDDEDDHRIAAMSPYDGHVGLHPDEYMDSAMGTPEGAMSPALTLVTAAASTPSRRPSPNPMRLDKRILLKQQFREASSATSSDHNHESGSINNKSRTYAADAAAENKGDESGEDALSLGGTSEMDDIVGVTTQRLLDCPDELGRTGLALASMKGHEQAARLLIDLGASLDLADFEGNRPLHYASAYNQLIMVQMLIEAGCSYLAKNTSGFTPADYAFSASLKSALEAFSRAQFDNTRVRQRMPDNSSPSLNDSGSSPPQTGNQAGSTRNSLDTAVKSGNNISTPSMGSSVIGLFPTPIRENPVVSSPQVKLSSQLRDIF